MTRLALKNRRAYIDGVDISGYANEIGSLDWMYDVTLGAAFSDAVMNGINGKVAISAGTINSYLDNDTAGLFNLANSAGGTRSLVVVHGTVAATAALDPMFAWQFEQSSYQTANADGFSPATIKVSDASYAGVLAHSKPWGFTLHPKGAETAANTAVGVDDNAAASALGGIFVYQLFSSNGTVTLSMDDAATNTDPSFSALAGATSGSIDASASPKHGMVALGVTATVRRYLRWQMALGTATTATFFAGFIRSS